MSKKLIRQYKRAGAHVEARQLQLAQNSEALERALAQLVRIANKIDKLRKERKRLLYPRPADRKIKNANWTPDKYIGSGGGAVEHNDDIPEL